MDRWCLSKSHQILFLYICICKPCNKDNSQLLVWLCCEWFQRSCSHWAKRWILSKLLLFTAWTWTEESGRKTTKLTFPISLFSLYWFNWMQSCEMEERGKKTKQVEAWGTKSSKNTPDQQHREFFHRGQNGRASGKRDKSSPLLCVYMCGESFMPEM